MSGLRQIFVEALPPAARAEAEAIVDLDARLTALVDGAGAEAGFTLDPRVFVAHLGERLRPGDSVADGLAGVCAADLFLACACFRRVPEAIEVFRQQYGGLATAAATRVVGTDGAEDAVAETMNKLLVSDGGKEPALGRYAGRGRLGKWVQTVTLRLAHSRTRKRTEQARDDIEDLADRVLEAGDAELSMLKRTYRAQFKAAFREAVEGLSPRERNLLRLELLDRLTLDQIAAVYDVHAATISRWRADTRGRLLKSTRRIFEQQFNVGRDDFHSIMRMIQSQFDVSLPRLLQDTEPEHE